MSPAATSSRAIRTRSEPEFPYIGYIFQVPTVMSITNALTVNPLF